MTAFSAHELAFLAGEGEMAGLMRRFDWDSTPLGTPEAWPPALKAMVRMSLTTCQPVLIVWGHDHLCLYNDALRASLGADAHPGLLGHPGPGWAPAWESIGPKVDKVLRGGGPAWHEDQPHPAPRDAPGHAPTFWTSSYAPIDDPGSRHGVGGVLVMRTETTARAERHRALEEACRRSDERLRLAVESTGLGTFDIGLTDDTAELSDAALKLFGLAGRHVRRGHLLDRIQRDDRDALRAAVRAALGGAEGKGYRLTLRVRAGPNDLRQLSVAGEVVVASAADGGGARTNGVVWDITEHQTLVDTLRHADQRKDEFLATLAHELRNPLAALRSASYLMTRAGITPERLHWCGEVIERQSKAMALLLDDLMEVSRITRGKVELKRTKVDLRSVVEAALETSRPALDARGHRLAVRLPDEPVLLEADPLRLAQVIGNLLSNAARYSEPGSAVQLVASVDDDALRLDVVDEGIGIAPERMATLFEMFHRIRAADDGATSGLGVGLAVSKGLVELHGGKLEATSRGLGLGATFSVTLPLPRDGPRAGAPPPSTPAASTDRAPRVLVADDNVDAAEAVATLLRMEGYAVDVVHDGVVALDTARARQPFAAFLDIGMPGMDGYQLATQIRRQPWGETLLLVAVTGWGQGADRDRAVAAGFDVHLTKPVDPEAVAKLLAERLATLQGAEPAAPRPVP